MKPFAQLPSRLVTTTGLVIAIAASGTAQTAPDHFRRGQALFEKDDVRGAVAAFTQALALDPKNAECYAARGKAHDMLNNVRGAFDDYQAAIAADPKCATAYNHRARLYEWLKERDRAKEDYDRAVEADPTNPCYWYNRGVLLHRQYNHSQDKAALRDLNEAIKLSPKKAKYYSARGSVYEMLNDLGAAMKDANAAVVLDPTDPVFWCNRGWYQLRLGQGVAANEDLNKAARMGSKGLAMARQTVANWNTYQASLRAGPQGGRDDHRRCSRCNQYLSDPFASICGSCRSESNQNR